MFQEEGLLAAGDLYFDRLGAGYASTGLIPFGNGVKLEIQPQSEIKERVSRKRESYGSTLTSVAIQKPPTISLSVDTITAENLALALFGELVNFSQAEGEILVADAVSIVVPSKEVWVPLGKYAVDADLVVKNAAGDTTYVKNTDYILHQRQGMIQILEESAIAAGATLKWHGEYGGVTGKRIKGGTKPTINARLLLDGINFENDREIYLNAWRALLAPSAPINFITTEFNNLEFTGRLNLPDDKDAAFEVIYKDV